MISALSWWSILLTKKNNQYYNSQVSALSYQLNNNTPLTEAQLLEHSAYKELLLKHKAQKKMILGEGIVFGLILLIGVWLINNAYHREIMASERQKNFLLSVTHELKSPIASVKLILETFLKRNLSPTQFKDFSSDGLNEMNRLEHLVGNLLTSSKIEAEYAYNFEAADFIHFLWEIADNYERKHPGYSFSKNSSHPSLVINFDPEALKLAVNNIMENAIKYSDKDTNIGIEVCADEEKAYIEISDEGIGVPEEEQEMVFEKFYRVGSEEVRKSKGTGLGLFIAKQFVVAHGGKIYMKQNNPKGSIVCIELPLSKEVKQ